MEVYDRVAKIVAPKTEKLRKATSELGRQMDKLDEKRSQLQEVDKLGEKSCNECSDNKLKSCLRNSLVCTGD